jgi:cell division protein FtsI (penicillin-binding protein 3)
MKISAAGFSGIKYLRLLFIVFFIIFLSRLFYIQVFSYEHFRGKALNQQTSKKVIESERGQIISKDGFVLATNNISYILIIDPSVHKNLKEVIEKISKLIDFKNAEEKTNFLNKESLIDPNLKYFILKKNLTQDERDRILGLKISGVYFEKEIKRFYPEGDLASSILGFVASSKEESQKGYYGIEGRNDQLLKGRSGRLLFEKGASGQVILFGNYDKHDSINGDSVVLTIDRSVQYILEKKLKEGVLKYGAKSGQIIVMNPNNGDILGMANFPSFDPYNPYKEFLDEEKKIKSEIRNKAISDNLEPGSVIKPHTIATALDLGLINQDFSFYDEGPMELYGDTIDNWDKKHIGFSNLELLLQKSNNIGASIIGLKVGSDNFKNYFNKFGFGRSTDIDLEGEEKGYLKNGFWSPLDIASAAFGQGFTATPLQVLSSYTVFLNDGHLVRPKIIKQLIKSDGTIVEYPNMIEKGVLKKDTANFMNKLLATSFANNESKYFNLKKYSIAGKTGTAQIAKDGKYQLDKTNALFVGYLTNSKKFSMIVRLEEPSSSTFAAETAVPLWMETASELVNYYNIPTDFVN